jgi:hypothetical protein
VVVWGEGGEMNKYPLRKGYKTPATEEVLRAVQNVIADWDGVNWIAVRHCIETTMPNAIGLDDWTIDDVRQRFAIGQRKMTIELGGRINTTDATIVPARFATITLGASGVDEWVEIESVDDFILKRNRVGANADDPEIHSIKRSPKGNKDAKRPSYSYFVRRSRLSEWIKPKRIERYLSPPSD